MRHKLRTLLSLIGVVGSTAIMIFLELMTRWIVLDLNYNKAMFMIVKLMS